MKDVTRDEIKAPKIVDRASFQSELDALRVREKAHTKEGDAIAAARRRLPMVEVDATTPLVGARGAVTLLDAFEGWRMLIAYYFMWHAGHPAQEQFNIGERNYQPRSADGTGLLKDGRTRRHRGQSRHQNSRPHAAPRLRLQASE